MQKRGLIFLILIASIGLVSAQAGIGGFLDAFGGENLLLLGSFVISFVLINFILGRLPVFKHKSKQYPYKVEKNKAVPGIISFILSLFIVYGINKLDFDIASFFSGFGIGQGTLELIAIVAIIGALLFLFWKFKSLVLLFLGLILVVVSFTDLIYEKDAFLFVGIALIVAWILIKIFFRKKKEVAEIPPSEGPVTDTDRQQAIRSEEDYKRKLGELETRRKAERARTAERLKGERARRQELERQRQELERAKAEKQRKKQERAQRPKATRREANFYLSFRSGEELVFQRGESEKRFKMGNIGGGRIKWNAHALPTNLIKVTPNQGVFGPGQVTEGIIQINRRAIPPQTPTPIKAAIGIHTLDRKRNKATFSARVKIY